MQSLNDISPNLAWFIGLYEGEGSTVVTNRGYTIQTVISMTDEDVISSIQANLGMGSVNGPYENGPGRKPYWRWQVARRDQVVPLLESIMPYLSERRQSQLKKCLEDVKPLKARPYGAGVRPSNTIGKWVAYGVADSKKIHLGTFSSVDEAITARRTWEMDQSRR